MDDLEALDSLRQHPGWKLFLAYVNREWGQGGVTYIGELDQALDQLDDALAASQARQIRAARKVIERLIRWPDEEWRRLRDKPSSIEPFSRRGSL